MRTVRLTADVISDLLPCKGNGDVVTVADDFAGHLLSIGAALEIKVDPSINREPIVLEKKTFGPASQPAQVSPEPIVKKRGRPPKGSSL